MPRAKKPAGTAADKRNGARVVLPEASGDLSRPELPEGLRPEAVATWEAFWSDPVSNATTAADHGILLRWVRDQSLYYHASDQFAENPIAVGSTGQDVLSQWHKVMTDAAARIRDAEDRLGMNPKARAALGIALGEARKTLDDLSNAANASASSSSAVSTTPPPGLVVAGELAAPPKRTTAAKKAAPAAPVEGHDDPRLSVRS